MNADPAIRRHGFTLIEVLVALAIVALGLIGVFGQVSQSATAASRLRDKTLADWIAINAITELRVSGKFPAVGTSSNDLDMANTRWHYEMKVSETDGGPLRRVDVTVSFADSPTQPIAIAAGFVAQRQKANLPAAVTGAATGWPQYVPGAELGDQKKPPVTPPPASVPTPPAPQPTESEQ